MRRLNSKGQVWVETVIYTLIGLAIIGLVLAVAKPKIDAKKDETMIEQAIQALETIDAKIYEVQRAAGNRRVVDLKIGKGKLIIDMEEDKLRWVIDSSFQYSEEDVAVPLGVIDVTTRASSPWEVTAEIDYSMNITYDGQDIGTKELDSAPTPYKLSIEYSGKDDDGNLVINIWES